jgi:hypothetical protein
MHRLYPSCTEARREELHAIIAQGRLERRLSDRAMKLVHQQQQQQQEQPVTDADVTNSDNDVYDSNVSPSTPANKVATALEPLGVPRSTDNNTSSSSNVPIAAAKSTNEADSKYSNNILLSKAQQQKHEEQQEPNTDMMQHRVPDFSPMIVMKSHSSDTAYNSNNSRVTSNRLPKQVTDSNIAYINFL